MAVDFKALAEAQEAERVRIAQLLELLQELSNVQMSIAPSVETVYHRADVQVAVAGAIVRLRLRVPMRSECHTMNLGLAAARKVIGDLQRCVDQLEQAAAESVADSSVSADSSDLA